MKLRLLTHSSKRKLACPYRYYLSQEIGLRAVQDRPALRFGNYFHEGVDKLNKSLSIVDVCQYLNHCYEVEAHTAETLDERDALRLEGVRCCCLVEGWLWRWQNEELEVLASELPFFRPIPTGRRGAAKNWRHAGVIDGIVKTPEGRTLVTERKTSTLSIEPDAYYWEAVRMDTQISEYMLAARSLGHDVDGVLYDVARRPELKLTQTPVRDADGLKIVVDRKGERVWLGNGKPRQAAHAASGWKLETTIETLEEYSERLINDIYARPDFYFCRQDISRTDDELAQCSEDLYGAVLELNHRINNGLWRRDTGQCIGQYGACDYLSICRNRIDVERLPEGFRRLQIPHPELENYINESVNTDTTPSTIGPRAAEISTASASASEECAEGSAEVSGEPASSPGDLEEIPGV